MAALVSSVPDLQWVIPTTDRMSLIAWHPQGCNTQGWLACSSAQRLQAQPVPELALSDPPELHQLVSLLRGTFWLWGIRLGIFEVTDSCITYRHWFSDLGFFLKSPLISPYAKAYPMK